jgi:hypothetical protein
VDGRVAENVSNLKNTSSHWRGITLLSGAQQTSGYNELNTLPRSTLLNASALLIGGGIYRAEMRFNLLESSMASNSLNVRGPEPCRQET